MQLFRSYVELKQVIVNLKTGTAFKAVCFKHDRQFYILRQAQLLSDRGARIEPKVLTGELLIHRSEVDFIQVI